MHIYCIGHDQWFQCYVCDITTMRPNMGEEIINVPLTIYERFWKKYYELKNKFIHYYKMLMIPRYKRNFGAWKKFIKSWKRIKMDKHRPIYTWTPDESTILNFPDMPIFYLPYHFVRTIDTPEKYYEKEKTYLNNLKNKIRVLHNES